MAQTTGVLAPFTFDSFMPVDGYQPDPFNGPSGSPGTTVTINGTGLGKIVKVTFNGTPATGVTQMGDTQIQAAVPTGATTGPISISDGTTTVQNKKRDFTVLPPVPEITGISPKSGKVGTVVTISGHHLQNITTVLFHKLPAQNVVTGANQQITATVPPGATTGPIKVEGPNGSAAGPTFTVLS